MRKIFVRKITKAYLEDEEVDPLLKKLCVRFDDLDLCNFGYFNVSLHPIHPEDFVGLTELEACNKFNEIVYNKG